MSFTRVTLLLKNATPIPRASSLNATFPCIRSYQRAVRRPSLWHCQNDKTLGTSTSTAAKAVATAVMLGLGYVLLQDRLSGHSSNAAALTSYCDSPILTSIKEHQDLELLGDTLDYLKPIVIFVLGGPGVGKGTQCERLVKEFGFVHLSAGDLLRAEQRREHSPHAALISECLKEGKIVPFQVTISLLKREMSQYPPVTLFLIDGFPREMDQAWEFEIGVCKSTAVLVFDCPEATMLERLMIRSATSGRTDDNIESIKKRFRTFTTASLPVIKWYEAFGMVRTVSCIGDPETVYQNTKRALADVMEHRSIEMSEKQHAHA